MERKRKPMNDKKRASKSEENLDLKEDPEIAEKPKKQPKKNSNGIGKSRNCK
jgi:hypothetical protein